MWSRNKANLYIQDALNDFHYDPKALSSPIAQRKIYRDKLMLTHLVGFGGGVSGGVGEQPPCYLFDASGDALSAVNHSDWHFSTGDWAIDMWVRYVGIDDNDILFAQYDPTTSDKCWLFESDSGRIEFFGSEDGSATFGTEWAWSRSVDTWYHVAVARDTNNMRAFVDGTQIGSTYDVTGKDLYDGDCRMTIGSRLANDVITGSLDARVDEVRISKGTNRGYTTTFTPASVPYTSDANTVLLIHCSETKSGTTGSGATFTDSGNTGHTITENGNAIQDDVFGKFT